MVRGMPSSCCACATAATAWLRLAPAARLKLIVTDGNCAWCVIAKGAIVRCRCAMAESGTCAPPVPGTRSRSSECGSACQSGLASSTTRYWLAWLKMVLTWRWPNAS